jgi:hypothetical protein
MSIFKRKQKLQNKVLNEFDVSVNWFMLLIQSSFIAMA